MFRNRSCDVCRTGPPSEGAIRVRTTRHGHHDAETLRARALHFMRRSSGADPHDHGRLEHRRVHAAHLSTQALTHSLSSARLEEVLKRPLGGLLHTQKTKKHPERGVSYTHKLSTKCGFVARMSCSRSSKMCSELLVIIYQDRRGLQALGESFLHTLNCCPQLHL